MNNLTCKIPRRLCNSAKWPIWERWRFSRRWLGRFCSRSPEVDLVARVEAVPDSRTIRLSSRPCLELNLWTISVRHDLSTLEARSSVRRWEDRADFVYTARHVGDPAILTDRCETCRDRYPSPDDWRSWTASSRCSAYHCFYDWDCRWALRFEASWIRFAARISIPLWSHWLRLTSLSCWSRVISRGCRYAHTIVERDFFVQSRSCRNPCQRFRCSGCHVDCLRKDLCRT